MPPDRDLLNRLDAAELAGRVAVVKWNDDQRSYTFDRKIGRGQTAVAWRVVDSMGRPYALKFVPRDEYATHSLDAEARLSSVLTSDRFARIDCFGTIDLKSAEVDLSPFYGVLVDWVEGKTLCDFLNDDSIFIDGSTFCALR